MATYETSLVPIYQGTLFSSVTDGDWTTIRSDTTGVLSANTDVCAINQAHGSTYSWNTFARGFMLFDLDGELPEIGQVSNSSLVFYLPASGNTFVSAEASVNQDDQFCITLFFPISAGTVVASDFATSRFSLLLSANNDITSTLTLDSFNTLDLSQTYMLSNATPFGYLGIGFRWENDYLNSEMSWTATANALLTIATSSASSARLWLNYELPEGVPNTVRRRMGLPPDLPRFLPPRTSTRRGEPILTLQQARVEKDMTATQMQDHIGSEAPPVIMRNIAITPNSYISAAPGTVLITPGNTWPIWVKQYGSGNTGWVSLQYQTSPFGSTHL